MSLDVYKRQTQTIVARLQARDKPASKDDLHALRTAANQAHQAAKELDVLCGMVEIEGA